jgi:hypothetical protein
MATLIRIITAETLVGTTVYPADTVLSVDDTRAAGLIAEGVAVSLEAVAIKDVDDLTVSTHKFGCLLALAAAAQTLDLTSLAAAGASRASTSTNFTAVHSVIIKNFGTGTMVLIVGNAAGTQFADWLGGATQTLKIPAGGEIVLRNSTAGGWTTSSKNNLKFDPGADTFKVGVVIGGIGA